MYVCMKQAPADYTIHMNWIFSATAQAMLQRLLSSPTTTADVVVGEGARLCVKNSDHAHASDVLLDNNRPASPPFRFAARRNSVY